MNSITLQFKGKEVEKGYRSMIFDTTSTGIQKNFQLITLVCLLWLIINSIRTREFNYAIIIPLVLFITVGATAFIINRTPLIYDYVLFVFQLGLNAIWCTCFILNINQGYFSDVNSYCTGYVIAYVTQCYNVGSRTHLKLFTVFINCALIIALLVSRKRAFDFDSILISVSGIMSMYHIHSYDKGRRQAYLIQNQQQQWEQNLDEVADVGLIQCTYDKKNNSLKLYKANKISLIQFLIQDQQSFRDFTRNLQVSLPQIGDSSKEQKMKLEMLLFYMFTDNEKTSHLLNGFKRVMGQSYSTSQYEAKGIFQSIYYKVKIFSIWKTEQVAVIQISKFEETLEVKAMKLKLQICRMAINSYQQQLQSTLVPSITLLKKLRFTKQNNLNLTSPQQNSEVLSKQLNQAEYMLYESFRHNINTLIFFKPKFLVKYQIFEPAQAILNALQVLKYKIDCKQIKMITEQAPDRLKIVSNYQLFHQLILNLLEQIMQVSKRCGEIYILYQPGKKDHYSSSIGDGLEFTILTNTTTVQELLADQIWFINPLSLKSCLKVCNTKKLNINLCVSHFIVGLLGPYSKIEYIQDESMCTIQFKIYSNLKEFRETFPIKPKQIRQHKKLSGSQGNIKLSQNLQSVENSNQINDSFLPPQSHSRANLLKTHRKRDFLFLDSL